VRRRRSRVEAERLVLEFERSGLTRRAFCVHHGLSVAALDKYRKRCRTCVSRPTDHQAILLQRLGLEIPPHIQFAGL
jgi:hypothetical protein